MILAERPARHRISTTVNAPVPVTRNTGGGDGSGSQWRGRTRRAHKLACWSRWSACLRRQDAGRMHVSGASASVSGVGRAPSPAPRGIYLLPCSVLLGLRDVVLHLLPLRIRWVLG